MKLLASTGDRLELARALADQTQAHAAAGDMAAAEESERQALGLIEDCGAGALRNLLQRPGVAEYGPDTNRRDSLLLSAAERRVAALVARGYTTGRWYGICTSPTAPSSST